MARMSSAVCLLLLVSLSAVYEVQGTFLLRHYLRKFPRKSMDFRPFACKGMLRFVDLLEVKSPMKPEYKSFFGKLKSYMDTINSASGSNSFDADLKGKAEGVQSAMSALGGTGGSSADTSKVMDVLMSMGKTLTEPRSGSTDMTLGQRRELILSMAKWARVIGQFVASTALKSGSSIDLSSLGIDGIDANVATDAEASPSSGGSPTSGTGGSTDTSSGMAAGGSTDTSSGTAAGGSSDTSSGGSTAAGGSASGSYMSGSTSTDSGSEMGGGSASSTNGGSATGGSSGGGESSFGRSFAGKTGSTSYGGSVNYQAGQKSSQQTASGGF